MLLVLRRVKGFLWVSMGIAFYGDEQSGDEQRSRSCMDAYPVISPQTVIFKEEIRGGPLTS
jgi:hypothetical protein